MDEPVDPPVDNPGRVTDGQSRQFEGREVPREPNGRVRRSAIPDLGEVVGTSEQITALTVRLAEIKAQGKITGARATLYKRLNMERARLMRKRTRRVVDRARLRLVRARTAERVARTAVDEAASAVAGAASVLRGLVDRWTKISGGPLAESLIQDLANEDAVVRQHAQEMIKDITIATFDLHKSAQRISKRDPMEPEKIHASWPTDGGKG